MLGEILKLKIFFKKKYFIVFQMNFKKIRQIIKTDEILFRNLRLKLIIIFNYKGLFGC